MIFFLQMSCITSLKLIYDTNGESCKNNPKLFLMSPIIKNQVQLTSLRHPLCAEKYQDDSCDLLTPEIHDEVRGHCRTNPDILPLRSSQLSHFPQTAVTQNSSTGGALRHPPDSHSSGNRTALPSLWRYSAEWRKGRGGEYDIGESEWVRDREISFVDNSNND